MGSFNTFLNIHLVQWQISDDSFAIIAKNHDKG